MSAPSLNVTVLTGLGRKVTDLSPDLRTIKAALLYADHVEWASPKIDLLLAAEDALDRAGSCVAAPSLTLRARQLDRWRAQHPAEDDPTSELDHQGWGLPHHRQQATTPFTGGAYDAVVDDVLGRFLEQSAVSELAHARTAGVLTMSPMDLDADPLLEDVLREASGEEPQRHSEAEVLQGAWYSLLTNILPSHTTYPMFDDQMSDALRGVLDAEAPRRTLAAASEPQLAAHFIGTIDSFPEASVSEILDVRKALELPLVRFRGAVSGMASDLELAPFDREFARVADGLYRQHVAPALLELDELTREARIRDQLWRQLISGAGVPEFKTALTIAAAAYAVLPQLGAAAAAAVGGAASGAAELVLAIAHRRVEIKERQQTNKFVFLHEANSRMRS